MASGASLPPPRPRRPPLGWLSGLGLLVALAVLLAGAAWAERGPAHADAAPPPEAPATTEAPAVALTAAGAEASGVHRRVALRLAELTVSPGECVTTAEGPAALSAQLTINGAPAPAVLLDGALGGGDARYRFDGGAVTALLPGDEPLVELALRLALDTAVVATITSSFVPGEYEDRVVQAEGGACAVTLSLNARASRQIVIS